MGKPTAKLPRGCPAGRYCPKRIGFELPASPHRAAAAEGMGDRSGSAASCPTRMCPWWWKAPAALLVPLSEDTLLIDVFARWARR